MILARWAALCCALCVLPAAWGEVLTLREAVVEGRRVALPHDWEEGFPGFSGSLEYRLDFAAPQDDRLAGVYVQRACANLEVRVNGEVVGSGGRMAPPVARTCYYPHLFAIPRALLRPEGNELRIRVAGHAVEDVSARQRAGGLSAVSVGAIEALQPMYDRQLFWNITAAQIIAAMVGVLGLAMVCLWTLRRRDSYLLYFGLFTAGWGLISTRLFIRQCRCRTRRWRS
ncbi:hypothetical protein HK414_22040 [Ramlibacter terrae]|uniref:7TM-DISM receptor extracellular domain-containing protein n=1 Tax=Ramlibacter terrae TaxID=2732511 RepID=A0ABX6P7Q5_9BURK|nr:hypothetical protein HK414_22040 [Ramlibacter terrae]